MDMHLYIYIYIILPSLVIFNDIIYTEHAPIQNVSFSYISSGLQNEEALSQCSIHGISVTSLEKKYSDHCNDVKRLGLKL